MIDSYCRAVMWSRALPTAGSKKVTSDAGSDGLDALLAECALERSSSTSARSPARAPARPVVPPPPPQQQQRVLTSDECRARDAVVALQQALADAAIAAAVDRTLKSAGAVDRGATTATDPSSRGTPSNGNSPGTRSS